MQNEYKSVGVMLSITKSEDQWLKQIAAQEGISRSAFVRKLIKNAMETVDRTQGTNELLSEILGEVRAINEHLASRGIDNQE